MFTVISGPNLVQETPAQLVDGVLCSAQMFRGRFRYEPICDLRNGRPRHNHPTTSRGCSH